VLLPECATFRLPGRAALGSQGVDHKTIAEIVGHSDVRLTKNVYQHAQQESKRAGLAKVGKFLGRPVAPSVAPSQESKAVN
jgi:integrase